MTPFVPPPALALLTRQGGLARRRDLRRCGLTRRGLDRLVAVGALRPVAGDVLSARADVPGDESTRAAVVALAGAASHGTAARAWGIEVLEDDPACHVTVGRDRSRAAWPEAAVHRRQLDEADVRVVEGMRTTSPLRTVLDLCRTLPLPAAVVAADSALRRGLVSRAELRRACVRLPSGRERSRVAAVVRLVDPASGSVLESLCRVLFHLADLPLPQTQFPVRGPDGRLAVRAALAG